MIIKPARRRTLPPLNAVRAFEAAARLGSFKDAAVELGVTQGAISQQVRTLEHWLGAPSLFKRATRRVLLTDSGAALLEQVGPALDRISDAARQHVERQGQSPAMVLKVNALATFSLRWLLPRMTLFRAEHPDIEVRLTTSNDAVDALAETFDVVIRGGPDSFHGFVSRLLLSSGGFRSASPLSRRSTFDRCCRSVAAYPVACNLHAPIVAGLAERGRSPRSGASGVTHIRSFLSHHPGCARRLGRCDGADGTGRGRSRGRASGDAVSGGKPAGAKLFRVSSELARSQSVELAILRLA